MSDSTLKSALDERIFVLRRQIDKAFCGLDGVLIAPGIGVALMSALRVCDDLERLARSVAELEEDYVRRLNGDD